ncbi:MAG: winged helix-turn-helix transcriptional regulator [Methanobrevibacter sp.]|nr:winged helix-turn-helix transcriptional regulator [Candidatus Methanoflexus mossambicus]
MKIFKKRGEMTHFQILSEICKQEPDLRQKDIAERLNITVQAVSENIKILIDENYISSKDGRSPYKITQKGLAKVKKDALNLKHYADDVLELMNHYKSIWPAIAIDDLREGEEVGLFLKEGILYATKEKQSANALTLSNAKKGEDVALNSLTGIIDLENGQVVIITLPNIQQGGTNATDLDLIKKIYNDGLKRWGINKSFDKVGVMGTISRAVTNKLAIPVDIEFAVPQSAASATKKGLNILILAVGNMNKGIIRELDNDNIKYNIVDAHK